MRGGPAPGFVLLAAMAAGVSIPAGAVDWTLIDVRARLDNDGRLHVAETHHMRLELKGLKLFREFGLGADQAILFNGLTRIDVDGTEVALTEGEVDGPDRYRYYDRGHVYFAIPDLGEGATVSYRFDYELERAMAPAWAITAGPEPLAEDLELVNPWHRLLGLLADGKEAWPDLAQRFRLDHDILLPSREGPGFVVKQIDYRLEFDSAWKRVHPEAQLATVVPDDHYRVRPLFQYLGSGPPSAAPSEAAARRFAALAAIPIFGTLMWLGLLVVEAAALRRSGPVDRTFVGEHLLSLAPEEVTVLSSDTPSPPDPEGVLSRLATERKLAIEMIPPSPVGAAEEDEVDESTPDVRLRLLAPLGSFTAFERAFLAELFPRGNESGTALLNEVYRDEGFDPATALRTALASVTLPPVRRRLLPLVWTVVGALGFLLQIRSARVGDLIPIVVIGNLAPFFLARAWPPGWWHGGRPTRGLLLPLLLLTGVFLAWQLAVNRPLPAPVWMGGALVVLACHGHILTASRMPTGGRFTTVRNLARIRRFARAELRRASPQLEDAWIPRLQALGLAPDLERWLQRQGGQAARVPDLSDAAAVAFPGPHFTGSTREPFDAASGWTDALYVYADEEDEPGDEGP